MYRLDLECTSADGFLLRLLLCHSGQSFELMMSHVPMEGLSLSKFPQSRTWVGISLSINVCVFVRVHTYKGMESYFERFTHSLLTKGLYQCALTCSIMPPPFKHT